MKPERIRGHLDTLLLSIVSGGPAHGYEILSELSRRSGGEFELPEGTVYPALHRLEGKRLLSSDWDSSSGRRRRVYRLTAKGRKALAAERAEWRSFSASMDAVLGGVS